MLKKRNKELIQLFEDLFRGSAWIDVNLLSSLENLTYQTASQKIFSHQNSIWEIVNHLICWRKLVLKRILGKDLPSPANNFFAPVSTVSAKAWKQTIKKLKTSQTLWIQYLQTADLSNFSTPNKPNNMSSLKLLHGILQHDAYHLGQINLLVKFA